MNFPSGGIIQDLITIHIMDSWDNIGGSDAWVNHTNSMGRWWNDVWHCNMTKGKVFHPKAKWYYSDTLNWWTYGPVGGTPQDIWQKNIARQNQQAMAKAKANAQGKPKAKAKAKMKSKKGKVDMHH